MRPELTPAEEADVARYARHVRREIPTAWRERFAAARIRGNINSRTGHRKQQIGGWLHGRPLIVVASACNFPLPPLSLVCDQCGKEPVVIVLDLHDPEAEIGLCAACAAPRDHSPPVEVDVEDGKPIPPQWPPGIPAEPEPEPFARMHSYAAFLQRLNAPVDLSAIRTEPSTAPLPPEPPPPPKP